MKIAMIRVGVDTGSGGTHGPLFADGSFEFVPIPDNENLDERTYGNYRGRNNQPLITYFPAARQAKMMHQAMHVDPDFDTFTYGDPTSPKSGLRHLEKGDLLIFYGGLHGHKHPVEPALFLFGYFEVQAAGYATQFTTTELETYFQANFHVRHKVIFERQKEKLVLVKGSEQSRLLRQAVKISVTGQNRRGQPLKVLAPEMQKIFGSFNGKLSFQRSPTRWVLPEFINGAAAFIRSLP